MRKVLLLVASLIFVTAYGWGEDSYNRVVLNQAEQCKAEMSSIGVTAAMLAGNNMITDGQQQVALRPRGDFYNSVLAKQVAELQSNNQANWSGPTLLAGNNMITGGQAGRPREDFYSRVLSAKTDELRAENRSIGAEPMLLAGNNMLTGERVVFAPEAAAPEDFYNSELSAQVDGLLIDNNAIAPSATEFTEPQSATIIPGSMASNVGGGSESDWYSQTVAIQAELNRRLKKSQSPNGF